MNSPSEETLFANTVALPASERPAYLERACAGDAALRARVEALVQAHLAAGSFLDAPPTGVAAAGATAAPTEAPGDCIGPYKLLQKIGEGGCGTVYMAEQEEPVPPPRRPQGYQNWAWTQKRSSPVLRPSARRWRSWTIRTLPESSMPGPRTLAAPTSSWSWYAASQSPNTATNTTSPPPTALPLFIQVCHAVQHAHQKGIIHRDIKPSNILVTINDGVPRAQGHRLCIARPRRAD